MKSQLCLFIVVLIGFLLTPATGVEVPQRISYQGLIAKGGTNFTGDAHFKFALVNASGSQTFWSNDGTSVSGSQPSDSVALSVKKGGIGVMLGEGMAPVSQSVSSQNDLRLRVWVDVGEGFELLTPDQPIGSVVWAFRADQANSVANGAITTIQLADNAVTTAKLADHSITASKIAADVLSGTPLGTVSRITTPDGTKSVLQVAADGKIGIGTTDPLEAIHLQGNTYLSGNLYILGPTLRWVGSSREGQLVLGGIPNAGEVYLGALDADGNGAPFSIAGPGFANLPRLSLRADDTSVNGSFNVARAALLNSSLGVRGAVELGDSSVVGINGSFIDFHGGFGRPDEDFNVRLKNDVDRMLTVHGGGLIVESDLELLGNFNMAGHLNMPLGSSITLGAGMIGSGRNAEGTTDGTFIELRGRAYGQFIDFSNDLESDFDARIILTSDELLSVQGAILEVPALKIVGGADIAERFSAMNELDAIEPGMVVRYAGDGSQRIELCRDEMDRAVAGVISEAGGVNSGLVLEHSGTLASGKHKVAMLGRVQVWADASFGKIRVGDALVSSPTPGHAMRAASPTEAVGAMIGKATSNLETGRGLIWVHVSLK